jgi:phage-related protein
VGRAEVEVRGDVRDFARQTERDLDAALSKIELDPVKVQADTESARKSGRDAGKAFSDSAGEETRRNKGRFSNFLKEAFTPRPGTFQALRAPFAAALSTPVSAAVIAVAGTAAAAFVGAFATAIATAGLGAVFLGLGAAALFGAKKSRDEAQADLDKAEERVRKAQERAKSGTAAAKRSLAEARAELAKAQEAVRDNAAFTKLDNSLKRLGGTLKEVGQRAAQPLMGPFTTALDTLAKAAERVEPLLTKIFAGLAPAIGPLTDGMIGFVEEFLKVLTADPKTLEGMRDALIAVGQNLPRLGTLLGEVFALFASNENNVRNIGLLFGALESAITNVALTLYGLGKVLDGLIIAWDAIREAGAAAIDWIMGTAIPAIVGAAQAVGRFFAGIPGAISSAWSAVTGFFSNIWNSITTFVSNLVTSVMGFFTSLPGRVMAALAALPGLIGGFFSNLISNIAYLIGFGLGTVVSFFVNLPGRIMGAIKAIPGLVAGVFTAVWSTARSIVSSGISAVVGFFTQLPGRARSAISSLISIISSIFSSAAGSARSGASSLVSGAIGIIRGLPGQIRSALSTVRSAVTGAFSGAASWLVSAGRNIIAGVKNGITSAISGAVAAARNAAKRIVQGFKDALSIGSPSKVMEREVGRWIPEGVAEGIVNNMNTAVKASVRAARSFRTPLANAAKEVLDAINRGTRIEEDFTFRGASANLLQQNDNLVDLIKATNREQVRRELEALVRAGSSFPGRAQGGDGAALSGPVHVTIQAGAIVIQGQGREAGQEAAEAVLERLGQATLAR